MKSSMPTDGSQKKLDRESAKRCGKYNPAKDNPDEEPIAMLLPNFKSVRERCTGARIMRGKKVVQKLHQRTSSRGILLCTDR